MVAPARAFPPSVTRPLALVALLSCACAVHRPQTKPVTELLPESRPLLAGRTEYAGVRGPEVDETLLADVTRALASKGAFRHDPLLDAFARFEAETIGITDQRPTPELRRRVAWALGIVGDLQPPLSQRWRGPDAASRAAVFVPEHVRWPTARLKDPQRFGVALVRLGFERYSAALVAAADFVEFTPFPTASPVGAELRLEGHVRVAAREVVALVSDGERLVRRAAAPDAGGRFSLSLPLGSMAGPRTLAVLVRSSSSPAPPWIVVERGLPLWVGQAAPELPEAAALPPAPLPDDAEFWRSWLMPRYEQLRKSRGLPVPAYSPELSVWAQAVADRRSFPALSALGAERESAGSPQDLEVVVSTQTALADWPFDGEDDPRREDSLCREGALTWGVGARFEHGRVRLVEVFGHPTGARVRSPP